MKPKSTCGVEQARAQLPRILVEARDGQSSVITRHGKPMAAVVPVSLLHAQSVKPIGKGGVLALRGTGRDLCPEGADRAVADMRDEWRA